MYALNAGDGSTTGSLLALDATNGALVREGSTGRYPTDMTQGAFGTALDVIHAGSRTIARFGPGTLVLSAEKAISTPGTYDAATPPHLAAGRDDRVRSIFPLLFGLELMFFATGIPTKFARGSTWGTGLLLLFGINSAMMLLVLLMGSDRFASRIRRIPS